MAAVAKSRGQGGQFEILSSGQGGDPDGASHWGRYRRLNRWNYDVGMQPICGWAVHRLSETVATVGHVS